MSPKTIMKIKRSDENDIENCEMSTSSLVENFSIKTRRIYLFGPITQQMAANVIPILQIHSLSNEPVYMYINSPGGDVSAGCAIIDQMKLMNCPVYTIVIGEAYSMGCVIAAFGDKGNRFATKESTFMIHEISSSMDTDYINQLHKSVSFLVEKFKLLSQDLCRRLRITTKKLKELSNESFWMTSYTAKKMGFIDGIWTKDHELNINSAFLSSVEQGAKGL